MPAPSSDVRAPPAGAQEPCAPAGDSPRPRFTRRHVAALAAAILLAVAARLLPSWAQVFTPDGLRFGPDGDAYYHVLRSRVLAQEHRVDWRDPGLAFPDGADVPWPPLLDALVASAAWAAGGARPATAVVERVAALAPVVLAALAAVAAALFARPILGRRGAVATALLLAVVPVHVSYSAIGRTDHHVLEGLLLTALLGLLAAALERPPRARLRTLALATGVVLTASFWTWVGSTFHLAVLGAVVLAQHLLSRRDGGPRSAAVVGGGAAVAAALTAATFALLGPPAALHRLALGGVSALPVLASACVALWCGALAAAARLRPDGSLWRRAAEAAGAGVAVAGAALLAFPSLREALAPGFRAAGHGGEWSFIRETQSLLGGTTSVADRARVVFLDFGLLPVLAAGGLAELRRWWSDPRRRPHAVLAATLAAVFAALVTHMGRFGYYAALPLALFGAMGIAAAARAAARLGPAGAIAPVAAALVAMGSTLPAVRGAAVAPPRLDAVVRAVAPLRTGALPAEGALLVRWDAGHHARYHSGRPVVASPFGADVGRAAMVDTAAFFLAEDPGEATALLARRGVRWVVIDDPAMAALEALSFAPTGRPPPVTRVHDPERGDYVHCEPSFDRLVAARLYYAAGSSTAAVPEALGTYRLVSEVGPRGGPVTTRMFEVVTGAAITVRGARPEAEVQVAVRVATPLGQFTWTAVSRADAAGRATLRVPFSTGRNGTVVAGPYVASDGARRVAFTAEEAQVRGGGGVEVELSSAG